MKKAFTLNELLLALVIIGIIIVIVAPKVISNMDKKTKVVALEKTYTSISKAVKLLMIDERARKTSRTSLYNPDSTLEATTGEFVKKYLNVIKDCGTESGECFATSYVNLAKTEITGFPVDEGFYCATISGGASICMDQIQSDNNAAKIYIDVNGPEKPNIAGRDFFLMYLYDDGFLGDRVSGDGSEVAVCKANQYGSGCINRIQNSNWVMDY